MLSSVHIRFGWWALLAYLTLGIALEAMHAFKVGWYLDVGNESRHLVMRLAHAHGTLLAMLNIVFGCTLAVGAARPRGIASVMLQVSTVLLPGGFLLGGFYIHGGDPGLGIWLVPIGAVLFFASVLLIALSTRTR